MTILLQGADVISFRRLRVYVLKIPFFLKIIFIFFTEHHNPFSRRPTAEPYLQTIHQSNRTRVNRHKEIVSRRQRVWITRSIHGDRRRGVMIFRIDSSPSFDRFWQRAKSVIDPFCCVAYRTRADFYVHTTKMYVFKKGSLKNYNNVKPIFPLTKTLEYISVYNSFAYVYCP